MSKDFSKRSREHQEMLRKTLTRPGVANIARIHNHWQKADKGTSRNALAQRFFIMIGTNSAIKFVGYPTIFSSRAI